MITGLIRKAVVAYSVHSRRRKARAIVGFMGAAGAKSVLLSGAVGSGSQRNESIVERALSQVDPDGTRPSGRRAGSRI